MSAMRELVRTFSKEQINEMREYVLENIVFSDLVKERTKVEDNGNWKAVRCEFHTTKTTDAGRLRDRDTQTGENGLYFCNHPNCAVAEDPYNGRLTLTRYWQLANDFTSEKEAVVDLYSRRLGRPLPEGNGKPMSPEEKAAYEKDKRKRFMFMHVLFFYTQSLMSEEGAEALKYITEDRKIPLEYVRRYWLGYAPGRTKLVDYLESVGFKRDEVKEAKLLSRKGNDLYFERIVFPLLGYSDDVFSPSFQIKKAQVPNFYSRLRPEFLNEDNRNMKHRYTNRNFPLFNFANAKKKGSGLMIEGCFDTVASQVLIDRLVSMKEEGLIPDSYTVDPEEVGPFASYGTNGFNEEEHVPHLKRANYEVLYIAGDHDANFAGQTANIKRGKMLQSHLPNTQIRIVVWPNKDVNEMLINEVDPIEFLKCLEDSVSLEEYEILVALEKSGSSDIVRNQFEAMHRIEELLLNLNLQEENSLLKYKKTLLTLSKFIEVDVETIVLHILMLKYKNDLKNMATESNMPLKTLLTAELAAILSVFGEG